MPRPLPPEILGLTVDHLRDEQITLKACCLLSKSWISRTRKHLFAHVEFYTQSHIKSWKETFPDPSSSPAHYTRTLSIRGPLTVMAADVDEGDWIRTFRRLVKLDLDTLRCGQVSLAPLHGLSPTLKSLALTHASIPPSEVFSFICSFSLLEDLALRHHAIGSDADGWDVPSTSPKLTGSLDLGGLGGIWSVIHQLCNLPDGLHFNKITARYCTDDAGSMMDLVSRCLDTLESLCIYYYFTNIGIPSAPSPDLSEATKLKDVEFFCGEPNVQWVTMTLQTVKSQNLQRITLHLYAAAPVSTIEDAARQKFLDLDQLLAQFSTSHSIHPKVTCSKGKRGDALRNLVPILFPELMRRGVVDVVERFWIQL